ncbi:unnamed protein product [Kuraishia capsulata CBS 1993]|uniref:Elongation factor 1 alpha-like protein n=1 Tax=Kuraishia capsulata CBS 1993 TaxID=1382522 RepID=W6MX33_9ASCO|nr:uncharacterized protein KUCA_T00004172001 [Kuraishia capsulata CBS 1993]CDK28190.1 unnamed protein product [Kuraishia capsulata CBS 1993]
MINDNLGSKRRKLEESSSIFNVFPETNYEIAEKAKSNFSKPSPDDIVLKAQETNSQEIAVGVKALKLDSKKPAVTKPKKKIDVSKELGVKLSKPSLSFGVIGHVDSGKSTLAGRLLYDLKIVDSKTLHKLTKESESIGKASFALAWIMDQTKDERERGVTVDICQTQFKTEKSLFTMIDCPGHKSFIPQMINGISQADLTLLIVDAGKNAFESSFGLSGQTREQITIARNLGLDRLVVAVNKMDTADWQQDRFEQIVDELTQFLVDDLAFAKEKIRFVPISGLSGGNVVAKQKLSWYSKGTLMEVLEAEAELKHSEDSADRFNDEFIMSINDIETSSDDVLISGRVNSGKIQPGESIAVSPSGDVGVVDKIFANIESPGAPKAKQDRDLVIVGEFVTLKVKNLSLPDNVKVGDLVSRSNSPIQASMKIKCKITTFKMNLPLLLGSQFILFRNNISVPATLSNIEGRKKKHLGSNQDALVEIDLVERPIPVLTYAQDSKLGRVVLRKNGETIGAGTVEEVL